MRVFDRANIETPNSVTRERDIDLYFKCITHGFLRQFCAFSNPTQYSDRSITLYEAHPSSEDTSWLLLEECHRGSLGLDDVAILGVYPRPFDWDTGAKPPMASVLPIVYGRFGLNSAN